MALMKQFRVHFQDILPATQRQAGSLANRRLL
jgi:hypothetical protein